MLVLSRLRATGFLAFVVFAACLPVSRPVLAQTPAASSRAAPANAEALAKPRIDGQSQGQGKPEAQTRPRRERSQAQKANDDRMRACGAEWRTKKTELTAQGETWRKFSVACRARLKAGGA